MQSDVTDPAALRFVTLLSPVLHSTYEFIAHYIGKQVGLPAELVTAYSRNDFVAGNVHIGLLCGLLYSQMAHDPDCAVELLTAPVLIPTRYQGQPVYFSDMIVRAESPFHTFDDLRGSTWGYNERTSHSGWSIVLDAVHRRSTTASFFHSTQPTGSHVNSIQMVLQGVIDTAAIDSHVLDVLRWQRPELIADLRVVASLGPSSIPPLVVSKSLDRMLIADIRHILLTMHDDPYASAMLRRGLIDRFVPVSDEAYQEIYTMFSRVQTREANLISNTVVRRMHRSLLEGRY